MSEASTPPATKVKGVGRKTKRGITWTVLGTSASFVLRLSVLAALGRILSRHDFGVVAAAMTVIMFGNAVKDLGVGLALVQRKELEPEHVEAAFAFSMLLGVGLAVMLFALAGPICAFYDIPESLGIVRLLSVLFVLRGLALVPNNMCKREMQFRALTIVDLAGYISGATLSIVLAATGAGAWSIAWGYVLETAVNVGMLLYLAPPPRRLRLHRRHLRELMGFGLGQSAASLANYFANQGDYMVVGRVLGATELGVYQRAYELMRVPANVFTNVAGSVLFSAFAKVQDDPDRAGRAMKRAMFACAAIILPASAGLIVLAPEAIRIVLGPKWGSAVWPFRIMAISMLFRTTYKLGALVGRSSGEVFRIAFWQAVYAVCVIGGAMVSVAWGIFGVSCTTSFSVFVVFVGLTQIAMRTTRVSAGVLVQAHLLPFACAIGVGVVAWLVATALREAGMVYPVIAAASTLAGAAVALAVALVAYRRGNEDVAWLWQTVRDLVVQRRKKAAAKAGAPPSEIAQSRKEAEARREIIDPG